MDTLDRLEQEANRRGEKRWSVFFDRAATLASEHLSGDARLQAAEWMEAEPTDPPDSLPEPFREWWRTLMDTLRRFEVDGGLPASISPPPPVEEDDWKEAKEAAEDGHVGPLVILSFARVHRRLTHHE